jgi:hypothetical protein
MAHRPGRDCRLPSNLNGRSWTCPACGNVWSWTPAEKTNKSAREHVRNEDGSKLRWWQ